MGDSHYENYKILLNKSEDMGKQHVSIKAKYHKSVSSVRLF